MQLQSMKGQNDSQMNWNAKIWMGVAVVNEGIIIAFAWRDWEKLWTSDRIADDLGRIWTSHLPKQV